MYWFELGDLSQRREFCFCCFLHTKKGMLEAQIGAPRENGSLSVSHISLEHSIFNTRDKLKTAKTIEIRQYSAKMVELFQKCEILL